MVEDLLSLGVVNMLMALVLAIAVGIVTMFWRRPAFVHCLWLLVLLKLITPPIVTLSVPVKLSPQTKTSHIETENLPRDMPNNLDHRPLPRGAPVAAAANSRIQGPKDAKLGTSPENRMSPALWIAAFWFTGSLLWWLLAAVRLIRFRILLQHAKPASSSLYEQVRNLAQQIGLRNHPHVVFLSAPVSPLLLAIGLKPILVLPTELWKRLTEEQQRTLLVHELAHLRRRDHWVRRLELVVLGLYWWNPVVWYARRSLHHAEEQCCDAWVAWALPESTQAYAETIVETAAFLSETRSPVPLGASGIGNTQHIKRRLTMIMRKTAPRKLSAPGMVLVLLIGVALLPLMPTWAQTQSKPVETPRNTDPTTTKITLPRNASPQPENPDGNPQFSENVPNPMIGGNQPTSVPKAIIQKQKDELALMRIQVDAHRAKLKQAQVGLEFAESNYERLQRLAGNNVVGTERTEKARYNLLLEKANVSIAEAQLRAVQLQVTQAKRRLSALTTTKHPAPLAKPVDLSTNRAPTSREQVAAAQRVYLALIDGLKTSERADPEKCYLWSRRWLGAQRDLSRKKDDRIAAYADHLKRMHILSDLATKRYKAGQTTQADVAAAQFYLVEAQNWLKRARLVK